MGDVDILVNNARVIPGGDLQSADEAAWRAGWRLKAFRRINPRRTHHRRMKAAGGGVVFNNFGNVGENPTSRLVAERLSDVPGPPVMVGTCEGAGGLTAMRVPAPAGPDGRPSACPAPPASSGETPPTRRRPPTN